MKMPCLVAAAVFAAAFVGCEEQGKKIASLDPALWSESEWISAADAPVFNGKVKDGERAADGASWFVREVENEGKVVSAKWMTAGLGVYEIYVNGRRIGRDALKPGFTHVKKTRRSFTYDVTDCMKKGKGERNCLAAEVTAGWWRDKIVAFAGRRASGGRSRMRRYSTARSSTRASSRRTPAVIRSGLRSATTSSKARYSPPRAERLCAGRTSR